MAGLDGPPLTARSGRVAAARRLTRRQVRRSARQFLVEGPATVGEALGAGALTELFVGQHTIDRYAQLVGAARAGGVRVDTVTDDAIASLSDTTTPQGVVGIARAIDVGLSQVLAKPAELVVVLHELRDPANVGTIVRSADAAGAQAVIVTRASADPYNGKAVRSSAGSLFHVPIAVDVSLSEAVQGLRSRGCRILAADAAGRDVTTAQESLRGPIAWVFSNEAHGLGDELRQAADQMLAVPLYGSAESLNVAMAATVCLYVSAWARLNATQRNDAAQWMTAGGRLSGAEVAEVSQAALQVPCSVREDPAVPTTAYDELPDGLLVVSAGGEALALNRAGARLLGVEPEQAVGRHVCHVLGLSDERGHDWWSASARLRAMPGVTRSPEQRLVLALPAGEREVLATCRYVREAGSLTRIVVAFRDTEARERAERSRADLVSTVAHELRSPLTSVKGFTATLLAKWDRFTDPQKKIMLETVNADADRVTRLISELLDVSRIDSGRLELHPQVMDLAAAVRRVFAGRVAAGEPEERFQLRVDGEFPEMWLDPDKIDQVLENLVENALRHGAGTVTVQVHGTGAGAEVTVTDEGEGIPTELHTRIFAKFWRGQPRRGGTGLGLYITRGIVEAHGGSITAGRADSGGAQFRFFLPAGTPAFA